jgi:CheY-like chemotaxis protein
VGRTVLTVLFRTLARHRRIALEQPELPQSFRGATVSCSPDTKTVIPAATRASGPKLLIVDDDPEVRSIVAEFLVDFGYRVVQANGGREALDLLAHHPDLRMIISDVRMPDMSGIELADIATRRQHDLKIILISGYFFPNRSSGGSFASHFACGSWKRQCAMSWAA